jgi:hypothetical protein
MPLPRLTDYVYLNDPGGHLSTSNRSPTPLGRPKKLKYVVFVAAMPPRVSLAAHKVLGPRVFRPATTSSFAAVVVGRNTWRHVYLIDPGGQLNTNAATRGELVPLSGQAAFGVCPLSADQVLAAWSYCRQCGSIAARTLFRTAEQVLGLPAILLLPPG